MPLYVSSFTNNCKTPFTFAFKEKHKIGLDTQQIDKLSTSWFLLPVSPSTSDKWNKRFCEQLGLHFKEHLYFEVFLSTPCSDICLDLYRKGMLIVYIQTNVKMLFPLAQVQPLNPLLSILNTNLGMFYLKVMPCILQSWRSDCVLNTGACSF